MTAKDDLYWDLVGVLKDRGHSTPKAKAIYKELLDVIEQHLLNGRLHIKGLVTVTVTAKMGPVRDGFTKRDLGDRLVVRGSAMVRRRLRAILAARMDDG